MIWGNGITECWNTDLGGTKSNLQNYSDFKLKL
jgi:hypothetical protein